MPENRFGPLVSGIDVANALRTHVRRWAPSYLAEVGGRSGRSRDGLPMFRSYVLAPDEDRFPEDQLPSCLIVIPTVSDVYKSRNAYRAAWDVRLGAVVKGQNRDNSLELVMLYILALRAMTVQHPSLGGVALSSSWEGERYDTIDLDGSRTLGIGTALFTIEVESVVDSHHGPTEPPADPIPDPGPWGTVLTHNIFISVQPEA